MKYYQIGRHISVVFQYWKSRCWNFPNSKNQHLGSVVEIRHILKPKHSFCKIDESKRPLSASLRCYWIFVNFTIFFFFVQFCIKPNQFFLLPLTDFRFCNLFAKYSRFCSIYTYMNHNFVCKKTCIILLLFLLVTQKINLCIFR